MTFLYLYNPDMKPKTFLTENKNGVLWLRLNRPERMNALTFEVYQEFIDYFYYLQKDDSVKVVVITGQGSGFCSGGDVNLIISELMKMDAKQHLEFTRVTCDAIRNIRLLRKPVIAAINGVAAGAGACIALGSDIRICSDQARFAYLFNKVGLSGADMGAAYLLPKVVGLGRAFEILLMGDFIGAQEAYRIGLVNKVVPLKDLEMVASEYALKLRNGPLFAIGLTKEMMNHEMSMSLEQALDTEASVQALCMQYKDFNEAHSSYKEKRSPNFDK